MSLNEMPRIELIEASAGTGKTYQITQTIIDALKADLSIDQLMVVTFTEKAAENMRGRIRQGIEKAIKKEIKEAIEDPTQPTALSEVEVHRLKDALSRFDESSIGTIHSIAHALLQEYRVEHGLEVSSQLSGDDGKLRDELVEDTLLELLGEEKDSAWHRVLSRTYLKDIKTILDRLVRELISYQVNSVDSELTQLDAYLICDEPIDESFDITQERALFSKRYDEGIKKLRSLIDELEENKVKVTKSGVEYFSSLLGWKILEITENELPKSFISTNKDDWIKHTHIEPFKSFHFNIYSALRSLGLALLGERGWQKWSAENNLISAQNCVPHPKPKTRFIYEKLHDWKSLAFARILHRFVLTKENISRIRARLKERKEALEDLNFDELLVLFERASHSDPLQHALRDRFKLICVDEFQDTNLLQWDAFKRLFNYETCRLLLVGDPKQSIYSFRGGDVHTYMAVKEQDGVTKERELKNNWRSSPTLIFALNAIFNDKRSDFIPDQDDMIKKNNFEVPLVRYPAEPRDQKPSLKGQLHLRAFDHSQLKGLGALYSGYILSSWIRMNIGHYIAQDLIKLCQKTEPPSTESTESTESSSSPPVSISRSDCAVLVNTNHEARSIQRTLSRWGIASALVIDQSVWATEAAQSAILWLDSLLNLDHEGKVSGALSSPLFGLTHQDTITKGLGGEGSEGSEGSEGPILRLQRQAEVWLERGKPLELLNLYERPYYKSKVNSKESSQKLAPDLLQLLERPQGHEFILHLRHLLALLQQCADSHGLSPQAQLAYLRSICSRRLAEEGGMTELPEAEQISYQLNPNVVQIVTIHKAKGLEYKAVFCASLWSEMTDDISKKVIRINAPLWSTLKDLQEESITSLLHPEPLEQTTTRLLIQSKAPQELKDEFKTLQKRENSLEKLRKLYVAFTRAEEHLFMYSPLVFKHSDASKNMSLALLGFKGKVKHDEPHTHLTMIKDLINARSIEEIKSQMDMAKLDPEPRQELLSKVSKSVKTSVTYEYLGGPPSPSDSPLRDAEQIVLKLIDEKKVNARNDLTLNNYWTTWSYSSLFKGKKKATPSIATSISSSAKRLAEEDEEDSTEYASRNEEHKEEREEPFSLLKTPYSRIKAALGALDVTQGLNHNQPLLDATQLPLSLRASKLGHFIHEIFELWDLEAKTLNYQHGSRQKWARLFEQHGQTLPNLPLLKWVSLRRAILIKMRDAQLLKTLTESDYLSLCTDEHSLLNLESFFSTDHLSQRDLKLFKTFERDLTLMATTPLRGAVRSTTLADLQADEVLHELEFDFPIGRGLSDQGGTHLRKFSEAFKVGRDDSKEMRRLMAELLKRLQKKTTKFAGMMTGSIDLVFRKELSHTQPDGTKVKEARYFIADYKTNFVAPLDVPMKSELSEFSPKEQERALAMAAYDPYNLATHMLDSNYHMQAHIYLVALHRYLQARLGDTYDYDLHVGGYYYLYCRGMIGPHGSVRHNIHTSQHFAARHEGSLGVFYYRPPKARIEALSSCLMETSSEFLTEDLKDSKTSHEETTR